jgi:Na+/H+ antiporter NhaC
MKAVAGGFVAIILGALFVLIPSSAYAVEGFESGNELFAKCTDKGFFNQGVCYGYVEGIAGSASF